MQTNNEQTETGPVEAIVRTLSAEQILSNGWNQPDGFQKTINGIVCELRTNRSGSEWWFCWRANRKLAYWPRPLFTLDQLRAIEGLLESF